MANPYASVVDYMDRYGELGDNASERVGRLLDDTAIYLDAAVSRHGIDREANADALKMVACARVRYLEERGDGSASRTQQAGPYSLTVNYSRPLEGFDTWLRRSYGQLLGISGSGVACVAVGYGDGQ